MFPRVSESRTPATKNAATTGQKAPPRSTDSIAPCSPAAAEGDGEAAQVAGWRVAAAPIPALATGVTVPLPPKPARLTVAAAC